MMGKRAFIKKRLLYWVYLFFITIVFLEIILRVYYPFQRKIRGHKWEMSTNITYHLKNNFNKKLDSIVINKRNGIGFRGEDPTSDINERLTIVTIGGSTTACTFLSEGKTWTDRLGIKLKELYPSLWINNAGLDGHSTYGHLNLMYYYFPELSFKPKIALFLIGANDVDRNDLASIDSSLNKNIFFETKKWLMEHSETINFLNDLKWELHPGDIFTDKQNWNFTHFQSVHLTPEYIDSALQKQDMILGSFRKRLNELIELCTKYNIQPLLITQPSIFGDGTLGGGDPAIDFHVFKTRENGQLFWMKLELYNNITKEVAREKQVPCIDLATLMPKDTLYYYDIVHYTNEGAQKVACIIYDGMKNYLAGRFANLLKKQ